MARYSRVDLDADLVKINAKLEKSGTEYRLQAQHRNNYTALDLYKNGGCVHMIASGSPRECKAGAFEWVVSNSESFIF